MGVGKVGASVASEESKSIPPARPRESGGTQKEHTASRAREELNSGRITRTLESRSTRSHSSKSYTHMKDAKRTISEQSIHTMKAKVKAETDSEVGKKEVVVKPDHVSQPNARVDGMGKIIEHSSSAKKERVKAETDSDVGEKVGKTVEHSSSAEKERAKAETDSEVGEKEVAVKPQRSKVPDTSKALASPPEENKDVKKEQDNEGEITETGDKGRRERERRSEKERRSERGKGRDRMRGRPRGRGVLEKLARERDSKSLGRERAREIAREIELSCTFARLIRSLNSPPPSSLARSLARSLDTKRGEIDR
eukprot:1393638-Amorphochlora_amoeboformis.AAC.3